LFNFFKRKSRCKNGHTFRSCRYIGYMYGSKYRGVAQKVVLRVRRCEVCGKVEGSPELVEWIHDIDSLTLDSRDFKVFDKFGYIIL